MSEQKEIRPVIAHFQHKDVMEALSLLMEKRYPGLNGLYDVDRNVQIIAGFGKISVGEVSYTLFASEIKR